jgi:hypothetical protein
MSMFKDIFPRATDPAMFDPLLNLYHPEGASAPEEMVENVRGESTFVVDLSKKLL